ncbi:MAG: hypothetical protein OEW84_00585 [Aigarchaeota archaeon]|nr:hypothetical protein [Aigarchaeota archaeon]
MKISDPTRVSPPNAEAEVRSALLRHYTDQLVSHAALLLTLAIPTLTALQICLSKNWVSLSVAILVVSLTLGSWVVFRFLYHARMAGHVMYRKAMPINKLESFIAKRRGDERSSYHTVDRTKDYGAMLEAEATDMYALNLAAQEFDKAHYPNWYDMAHFLSIETRHRKPAVAILYGLLLFSGLAFPAEESLTLFLAPWILLPIWIRFPLFYAVFIVCASKYWG